jgi:hypothetical protein
MQAGTLGVVAVTGNNTAGTCPYDLLIAALQRTAVLAQNLAA